MKGKTLRDKFRFNLTILVVLAIIIYLIYINWGAVFFYLEDRVPFFSYLYGLVENHIIAKSLLGMFIASFFGGLFFILLPLEVTFSFFQNVPYPMALIATILFIGNLLGLILDYGVGYAFGERFARKMLKHRFEKYQKILDKVGGLFIIIASVIFFPNQAFSVLVGSLKYPFKKFFWYTFTGNVIKFGLMIFAVRALT